MFPSAGKSSNSKDNDDKKEDHELWSNVEAQAAFLGPNLWDKTLPYDADLKVQEVSKQRNHTFFSGFAWLLCLLPPLRRYFIVDLSLLISAIDTLTYLRLLKLLAVLCVEMEISFVCNAISCLVHIVFTLIYYLSINLDALVQRRNFGMCCD